MARIALVTDSTADISDEMVEALGIRVVPLTVTFDNGHYLDRVEVSNEELYTYLKDSGKLPVTSQPTPAQFVEVYQNCLAEGAEAIISVHIAGSLSGTINGASMAADMVQEQIPVYVVDSGSATAGLGLQLIELAGFLKSDPEVPEALNFLQKMIDHTEIYFIIDTLDNLAKGGRIGKASYLVGSLLNIKPTLRLKDGVIEAHDKIRTTKEERILQHLLDVALNQHVESNRSVRYGIAYNDNIDLAGKLAEMLRSATKGTEEFPYFQLGSVVSTHVGLGALGIVLIHMEGDTPDELQSP